MTVIDRLWRRVMGIVAIVRLTTANDTGGTQLAQVQINSLQTHDGLPVLAHFGFSSNAPQGAIGVAIFGSGDRSNGVIIATGDAATRPTSHGTGETVVYNAFQMSIWLRAAGIVIDGGGQPITINNSQSVTINASDSISLNSSSVATAGNLTVGAGATGTFTANGGVVVTVRDGIITNIF